MRDADKPEVDLGGIIVTPTGTQWQAWGKSRRGETPAGGDVRWFEVLVPPSAEPLREASDG